MLDFLGFIKCTVPVHASGARAPAVFVAVPPPDGLPLQTRPAPDSTEHRREVAFYEQDAGQGCMRGRTWAVCAEFYPKLCAARGEGDEDIVEVMRTGVMRELVADGAADLGTRIRDLSLGIDVPGTEDYLAVVRLEHGPVADFHREYKFPGWCLGVVAKHDIPRGSLLCLMVGQIREYSEAYDESEMSQDDASGAGSQDDASGAGSQDDASGAGSQDDASGAGSQDDASGAGSQDDASGAGSQDDDWCREAYDYDLLHLPEDAMGPTFLECVDYGNIARCFNESDRPNAEFVHVRVNDIPMRAVFSTRGIAAGEDVCVRYDDKHWDDCYGVTRESVLAPEGADGLAAVVISDSEEEVRVVEAPRTGRRRRASHRSGFYAETAQAEEVRRAPPGGRRA